MQFIYLHGLASSPNSKKALAFKKAFEKENAPLLVPDLENGDFENLTISGQLKIIENLLKNKTKRHFGIVGSSLGGYLAALTAERNQSVCAIYLMAPAFEFFHRWKNKVDYNSDIKKKPSFLTLFQTSSSYCQNFLTIIRNHSQFEDYFFLLLNF